MVNIDDVGKPGGWLVEVTTPGGTPRYFYVYELDESKALDLAKQKIPVHSGETVEAKRKLNILELKGFGMKPGDVQQHA